MKIALAQVSTYPGKISKNTEIILSFIDKARKSGCNLAIFPELCIPGYAVMDLAYSEDYINENLAALTKIVQNTQNISVVIGFIDFNKDCKRSGGRPCLYNSAAIIDNGKLIGVQDKTLLPNYDIFFEDRYFCTARSINTCQIQGKTFGGLYVPGGNFTPDFPCLYFKDAFLKS